MKKTIMVSGPTNGTLSGSGANRTYTPNSNYEGVDHFTFTAADGVWSSPTGTVTIYVVAGPANLTGQCPTNGAGIVLAWELDRAAMDRDLQKADKP